MKKAGKHTELVRAVYTAYILITVRIEIFDLQRTCIEFTIMESIEQQTLEVAIPSTVICMYQHYRIVIGV